MAKDLFDSVEWLNCLWFLKVTNTSNTVHMEDSRKKNRLSTGRRFHFADIVSLNAHQTISHYVTPSNQKTLNNFCELTVAVMQLCLKVSTSDYYSFFMVYYTLLQKTTSAIQANAIVRSTAAS